MEIISDDGNEIAKRFGERVREFRMAKGWTQAQLADSIGKHKSTVTKIEAGGQQTLLPDVLLLSHVLGVGVDDLVQEYDDVTVKAITFMLRMGRILEQLKELDFKAEGLHQQFVAEHQKLVNLGAPYADWRVQSGVHVELFPLLQGLPGVDFDDTPLPQDMPGLEFNGGQHS